MRNLFRLRHESEELIKKPVIVEIGIGSRPFLYETLSSEPQPTYIGVDKEFTELRAVQKGNSANRRISLVNAKLESLPFTDHSTDVVIASNLFSGGIREAFTSDVIEEVRRILNHNGKLLCVETNTPSLNDLDYFSQFSLDYFFIPAFIKKVDKKNVMRELSEQIRQIMMAKKEKWGNYISREQRKHIVQEYQQHIAAIKHFDKLLPQIKKSLILISQDIKATKQTVLLHQLFSRAALKMSNKTTQELLRLAFKRLYDFKLNYLVKEGKLILKSSSDLLGDIETRATGLSLGESLPYVMILSKK